MSIERAKFDISRLTSEADRLRSRLAVVVDEVEKLKAYIEMAQRYESGAAGPSHISNVKGAPLSRSSSRQAPGISVQAVDFTIAAIREAGRAIHTRDLLDALAKHGIVIGGHNPIANLSGFLSRSDSLKNSRSKGWSLAEWPSDVDPARQESLLPSAAPWDTE